MPPGDYAQEKALKQEEKLIGQLEHLELTSDLIKVLRDQVLWLLDGNDLFVSAEVYSFFFLSFLPGGFLAQRWGLTWLAQCAARIFKIS